MTVVASANRSWQMPWPCLRGVGVGGQPPGTLLCKIPALLSLLSVHELTQRTILPAMLLVITPHHLDHCHLKLYK